MNPLLQLAESGQSLWVDNLQRSYLTKGTLKKFIDEDALKGLTSNPTIFQKAVEDSADYQDIFDQYKDAEARRERPLREARRAGRPGRV